MVKRSHVDYVSHKIILEQLVKALATEKAASAALKHKLEELQRLLHEKGMAVDSLRKQLLSQLPRENERRQKAGPFEVPTRGLQRPATGTISIKLNSPLPLN